MISSTTLSSHENIELFLASEIFVVIESKMIVRELKKD